MPRWSTRPRTLALAAALAAVLPGCASRTVPASFPTSAAASPAASPAPRVPVTAALTTDPPLPGEPLDRWPGLRSDDPRPAPHAGHGGHHGR